MTRLVVVESPTKAQTIGRFLPRDCRIESSVGHIRDLPSKKTEMPPSHRDLPWEGHYGVDVDNRFEPVYVVSSRKRKVVQELREALRSADELYIATDEDREGESIGWHIVEELRPKVPVRRMVFHEITREAILRALNEPRGIDRSLVKAQETRRVLDRLVGYNLSKVLWRKIARGLSGGRVQSVAVRLLVVRERERMAFVPASYWGIKATLAAEDSSFEVVMTHVGGIRLATGRDFDDETGKLKGKLVVGRDVLLWTEQEATALARELPDRTWRVVHVHEKVASPRPYPPFITSTLQQEANRKLKLSARRTMQIAQGLYERGFITYIRTDSTQLSREAIEASRRAIEQRYGKEFLSPEPRQYTRKVANAQEAHEAIRPAGRDMKTKDEQELSGVEGALYDLIWKRTIASQMANARERHVTVRIDAGEGGEAARFRAKGRWVEFPGFYRAYVEGSDDPEAAMENRDQPLPPLAEGDEPACRGVEPVGHETHPPHRYTEAALVRLLEEEGIGRPSTYASIIEKIMQRGYVRKQKSSLVPTFMAFASVNLLEEQFEKLVDVHFTAEMEQILDDIASGDREATPYLEEFYRGEKGLVSQVEAGLDQIDPRKVSTITSPKWEGLVVRVGKFGPYVEGELDGRSARASIPDALAPGDIAREDLLRLLQASTQEERVVCVHPEEGLDVLLRTGPYGPYVQLGRAGETKDKPKRVSLPKGMQLGEVNVQVALDLLKLPRLVGNHPETGQPIEVHTGRYGPYVQLGRTGATKGKPKRASLEESDDVLTIDLDRALALLSRPISRRGADPLRTLGNHPETGDPVNVYKGRYGPYVKHGTVNATIPKDLSEESITLEVALTLLADRKSSAGKRKRGRRRKKSP